MKFYKVLIRCPGEDDRELTVKGRSREDAIRRAIDNEHCMQIRCWNENNPAFGFRHIGIVWRVNGVYFRTYAWAADHLN